MRDLPFAIRREWVGFLAAERSMIVMHILLVACWALLLATGGEQDRLMAPLWFAMFAVIISTTFTSTVFVSERVSGSLEILLCSGISRDAILFGKMGFVICMTLFIGALCVGTAVLLHPLVAPADTLLFPPLTSDGIALYFSAAFLLAASSAWLSVVLPNPRMLHLVNLIIIGAAASVSIVVPDAPNHLVPIAMGILGGVLTLMARREFSGERITRPVIL